ncbi:Hypothetical predicted protein [Olea europaea subsp. europaea]|uniref:Retrovirus-related Pol polyprotein from transposon TNT 1-94 n=1 Tax=Olea europaea subsp. europaea TaxID=158383 RepID=A0A8S0SX76_OLEEU|nr:Hypothetical predicted protein [Olea europaea subsp. europaea]
MRALLLKQKCAKAIDESWPDDMEETKKTELDETAWNFIFLHLSDNMLREIGETKTAAELWKKLEDTYLNKTMPNKVYLLKQFFCFKLDPSLDLEANIDRFNKLSRDLADCDEKLSKDQLAVVLLNLISDKYKDVKNAIKYGRETLIIDVIINALRNKELELKFEKRESVSGENLMVKSKPNPNPKMANFNKKPGHKKKVNLKDKMKNKTKGKKYFYCLSEGHFIKDYHKRLNDLKNKSNNDGGAALAYKNEYSIDEVYVVAHSTPSQEWIFDSSCTFHMCPKRE